MKKKTKKRGRPVGSKNKKVFGGANIAQGHAKCWIACYGIDIAEQLAVRVLEIIRANKARLNEKYQPH